jgi:NADPH:quinone reductase-like Zn-dependent oxidoreductase
VRTHGGIDELVDYTDDDAVQKFVKENEGQFDCIYDTATGSGKGEDYVSSAVPKLLKKDTGEYVQINGKPSDWFKRFAGMEKERRSLVLTESKAKADLERVAELLQVLNVKPFLNAKEFDEGGVNDAFNQLKERRTKGKIVFNIA